MGLKNHQVFVKQYKDNEMRDENVNIKIKHTMYFLELRKESFDETKEAWQGININANDPKRERSY